MNSGISKQRQTDNEALLRESNESVQKLLKRDYSAAQYRVTKLHFSCECSDIECRMRIVLSCMLYETIHTDRQHFIIKPEHEEPNIEKIIDKQAGYYVVKKFLKPREYAAQYI
jgi:hypothetical protein